MSFEITLVKNGELLKKWKEAFQNQEMYVFGKGENPTTEFLQNTFPIKKCLIFMFVLKDFDTVDAIVSAHEDLKNLDSNLIENGTAREMYTFRTKKYYSLFFQECIAPLLTHIKDNINIGEFISYDEWKGLDTRVNTKSFFKWLKDDGFVLPESVMQWLEPPKRKPDQQRQAKEGGSNPETTKQNATNEACILIVKNIDSYLDEKGRISSSAFSEKVKACMEANGNSHLYQQTACNNFFHNDSIIQSKKRGRGRDRKPRPDA